MKIEKMTPGMVLHEHGRARDLMRTPGSWTVKITEVHPEHDYVVASWNSNRPERIYRHRAEKWKTVSYHDWRKRLEEKRAVKAAKEQNNG